MTDPSPSAGKPSRKARLRRRLSGALALGVTLTVVGIGYAAVASAGTPGSTRREAAAGAGQPQAADLQRGRQLYDEGCISCHGRNLQGVAERGPSLIGVGQAATYFQVATGRMPVARQEAQAPRKQPRYTDEQVDQIAAYVQSVGGGPEIPEGDLRDGDLAEGGELFRLNCANCHNFAGRGGALSAGKSAPNLADADDDVIYGAMLSGPQNMPVFGDNEITPEQKRAIINYVQTLKENKDPGGNGIGRLGPFPEAVVIFVVGVGALLVTILWIGAKS
jgi:ubiquinol-cytochrome c reductase cytochrome c subunit